MPSTRFSESTGTMSRRRPGVGDVRLPITTDSEPAQAFFDQGLALLYGFNHDEAARSFRRAAELDPALGMAFWGLALAVGPNYNEAQVDPERVDVIQAEIEAAEAFETPIEEDDFAP